MTDLKINTETYTLNDGNKIPKVGFGTMRVNKEGILEALKAGYRQLDTAFIYRNEEEVGAAIKESGIPREELFVVTKLWNWHHKDAAAALDDSLKKLGLDYVDLYLIHWPFSEIEGTDNKVYDDWNFIDTYKLLQKIYKTTNKVKTLGVSNFTVQHFDQLFADKEVDVVPAINQIEAHPALTQEKLMDYMKQKNIIPQAYSPLGGTGNFIFEYEEIQQMSKKYQVTPAQVLISWAVQRGTVAIPRTGTFQRIHENIQTFTLTKEDFEALNHLSDKYGVIRNNDVWRFEGFD